MDQIICLVNVIRFEVVICIFKQQLFMVALYCSPLVDNNTHFTIAQFMGSLGMYSSISALNHEHQQSAHCGQSFHPRRFAHLRCHHLNLHLAEYSSRECADRKSALE